MAGENNKKPFVFCVNLGLSVVGGGFVSMRVRVQNIGNKKGSRHR